MYQNTLRHDYRFEGKGLHTGRIAEMVLRPAPEDTGIVFVRKDLGGASVEALAENVSNTARSTTLSKGEVSVVTVEHVLSALTGLGVDNAIIELDNVEVPILDGSAKPYIDAISKDGLETQKAERKYIEIDHEIVYEDKEKGITITATPASEPSYDITIEFESYVVGRQEAHWDLDTDYTKEVGICRTFVFFHELEYLFSNNLIKGGDVDNAIVIVEYPVTDDQLDHMCKLFNMPRLDVLPSGYLSNVELHFPNECARHKLLDLIGDLRLVGGYLKANVKAVKSGHKSNTEAAKLIREALLK